MGAHRISIIRSPDESAIVNLTGRALWAFYLYLSNSCNLACRHCWPTPHLVGSQPDPGDVIDVGALRRAVQEAKLLGLGSAKLTGCVAQDFVDSRQPVWPDPLCAAAEELGKFPATRRRPAQSRLDSSRTRC